MKMQTVKFNFFGNTYKENRNVVVDTLCNGVTIINKGETLVSVNGIGLHPGSETATGESIAIEGNQGEIFSGRIEVVFTGAGENQVLVIQKIIVP